jgi:hypothetical protein
MDEGTSWAAGAMVAALPSGNLLVNAEAEAPPSLDGAGSCR